MEAERGMKLNLSGVGTASGGVYSDVHVQGVGKVYGDIDCLRCDVDGVTDFVGSVTSKVLNVRGTTKVQGNVTAEKVWLEGVMTISGNCATETFHAEGGFKVDGLLNADSIDVRLYGSSRAKEMGGETIRVEKRHKFSWFGRSRKLSVDTVEGDDIYLEYTKAKVVRGNRINIGPGCEIDLVEYRNDFRQSSDTVVRKQTKL